MENNIIKDFREQLRRLERELFMQNNQSCCNGVTLAQCHTLLEIENKGEESLTELSKSLGLNKSTISRTIEGLVNIGLVDRTIPAKNRRMSNIQLTKAGKRVCNTVNTSNDKYFEEIMSVLNDEEKNELLCHLNKVINKMVELRSDKDNCCK